MAWKEIAKLKDKVKELGFDLKTCRKSAKAEIDDIEGVIDMLVEANCMPLVMASSTMILRASVFWGKDRGEDYSGDK